MKNTMASRQATGFTLIELMVTLAVAGILLGIAVPAFNDMMERNRLANYSNEVLGALTFARNEARSRNTEIRLCSSADDANCDGNWVAANRMLVVQTSDNSILRRLSAPPSGIDLKVSAVDFAWNSGTSNLAEVLNIVEGTAISYDDEGQLVANIQGTRARRLCLEINGNTTPFSLFQSGQIQIHPDAPCPP